MKITKIFLLLSILSFMACSGDDDEMMNQGGGGSDTIEGQWKLVSIDIQGNSSVETAGVPTTSTDMDIQSTNTDYTVNLDNGDFTASGEYDLDGNLRINNMPNIQFSDSYTDVTGSGTYTVSGDMITTMGSFFELSLDGTPLAGGSDEATGTIEELTDNKLVITQDFITSETIQIGFVAKNDFNIRSEWSR